jgi:oxygen-independent coproporphyrinogen-3 oxidase
MLSDKHLTHLVEGIRELLPLDKLDEFSFEANPATFTLAKARTWKQLGISRVSLGVQSWDPHILQLLGRTHSAEQALESIRLLREAGIPKVNVDLMFSIPGQSIELWRQTLEQTIACQPDHISAYNLTYEEDTEFFKSLVSGDFQSDPDADSEYFILADKLLTNAGFRHYETSNFSRPGAYSKHNMGYWLGDDYLGIGPGAVGTIQGVRYRNSADTKQYINETLACGLPKTDQEELSASDVQLERVALLLRTDLGVELSWLPKGTDQFLSAIQEEGLAEIVHANQLTLEGLSLPAPEEPRLRLIGRGRLLVDEIVADLFSVVS